MCLGKENYLRLDMDLHAYNLKLVIRGHDAKYHFILFMDYLLCFVLTIAHTATNYQDVVKIH